MWITLSGTGRAGTSVCGGGSKVCGGGSKVCVVEEVRCVWWRK